MKIFCNQKIESLTIFELNDTTAEIQIEYIKQFNFLHPSPFFKYIVLDYKVTNNKVEIERSTKRLLKVEKRYIENKIKTELIKLTNENNHNKRLSFNY